MKTLLTQLLIVLILLCTATPPIYAQENAIPEPFCGELEEADCDLLRQSNDAMLKLESYATSVTYRVVAKGIPEMAVDEEKVTLRIDSRYALSEEARQSMRFFAVQSREDPLAAVQAIGEKPEMLINLYQGMTAELNFTLDVSEEWATSLSESSEIAWPTTTHAAARLVDGVIYLDIHELKQFIPELADTNDWVAIELVKILQALAEQGTFQALAANVADSSTGRSVWGLDPAMLNLITSMRATFGRPKALEPFMQIERGRDIDLADQAGAFYEIRFAADEFIQSDAFYDLLMQAVEVGIQSSGEEVNRDEVEGMVGLFWIFAPSIFRDLEIGGSYTIGTDDRYQHASETIIHWDLKTVVRAIAQISGEEIPGIGKEIYIEGSTKTENSAFNEPVTVEAPAEAQIIPTDDLMNLETLGYQGFDSSSGEASQEGSVSTDSTETITDTITETTTITETDSSGSTESTDGSDSKTVTIVPPKTTQGDSSDTTAVEPNSPPVSTSDETPASEDPTCTRVLDKIITDFTNEEYKSSIDKLGVAIDTACGESDRAYQLLGASYYHHYEQIYTGDSPDLADPNEVYQAITMLSKAIELNHDNQLAHYYRGLAFESFAQYGHAVDDLSRAIELAPGDPYAYYPRARIYAQLGQSEEARSDYESFLDLYPNDDEWRQQAEEKLTDLE